MRIGRPAVRRPRTPNPVLPESQDSGRGQAGSGVPGPTQTVSPAMCSRVRGFPTAGLLIATDQDRALPTPEAVPPVRVHPGSQRGAHPWSSRAGARDHAAGGVVTPRTVQGSTPRPAVRRPGLVRACTTGWLKRRCPAPSCRLSPADPPGAVTYARPRRAGLGRSAHGATHPASRQGLGRCLNGSARPHRRSGAPRRARPARGHRVIGVRRRRAK